VQAELARLHGDATVHLWTEAAGEWGVVGRPHEAAFCHWRAAELAGRDGLGTSAARLLRRAHAQARHHVPLLAAIERSRDDVLGAVPTLPGRRTARPARTAASHRS